MNRLRTSGLVLDYFERNITDHKWQTGGTSSSQNLGGRGCLLLSAVLLWVLGQCYLWTAVYLESGVWVFIFLECLHFNLCPRQFFFYESYNNVKALILKMGLLCERTNFVSDGYKKCVSSNNLNYNDSLYIFLISFFLFAPVCACKSRSFWFFSCFL